jgi:hypothetical protein
MSVSTTMRTSAKIKAELTSEAEMHPVMASITEKIAFPEISYVMCIRAVIIELLILDKFSTISRGNSCRPG